MDDRKSASATGDGDDDDDGRARETKEGTKKRERTGDVGWVNALTL